MTNCLPFATSKSNPSAAIMRMTGYRGRVGVVGQHLRDRGQAATSLTSRRRDQAATSARERDKRGEAWAAMASTCRIAASQLMPYQVRRRQSRGQHNSSRLKTAHARFRLNAANSLCLADSHPTERISMLEAACKALVFDQ